MRLTKAIKASRTNGARSRGPVTTGGKRRSSLNAVRHGLLSKNIVLENESAEIFSQLLTQHITRLEPSDDVEQCAVEEMVASIWRLRRMWAIERQLFARAIEKRTEPDEMDRIATTWSALAAGPELHLLDRYETRLHRMYQRSLRNLLTLKEFSAHPEAPVDAPETAEKCGLPNEPVSL